MHLSNYYRLLLRIVICVHCILWVIWLLLISKHLGKWHLYAAVIIKNSIKHVTDAAYFWLALTAGLLLYIVLAYGSNQFQLQYILNKCLAFSADSMFGAALVRSWNFSSFTFQTYFVKLIYKILVLCKASWYTDSAFTSYFHNTYYALIPLVCLTMQTLQGYCNQVEIFIVL